MVRLRLTIGFDKSRQTPHYQEIAKGDTDWIELKHSHLYPLLNKTAVGVKPGTQTKHNNPAVSIFTFGWKANGWKGKYGQRNSWTAELCSALQ